MEHQISNKNYDLEYSKLNDKQKLAVDTIEGTVLVIAGPGSGKTQILTLRIANILQKAGDISPENILCLTYTESGARTMRERLSKFIGEKATRKVTITTFHGFCMKVRNEYSEYFEPKELASDIEKVKILSRILVNGEYFYIASDFNKVGNVGKILQEIGSLKRESRNLEWLKNESTKLSELAILAKSTYEAEVAKGVKRGFTYNKTIVEDIKKKSKKLEEFYRVVNEYYTEMSNAKLFDFEDLIGDIVNKFKTNFDFSRSVQERFQYILVDEFQDTNTSQNEIVESLGEFWISQGENANIFVVGDDDQSIYKFQGAAVSNILQFKNKFPKLEIIVLDINYRSTQKIIDAARSIVKSNTQTIDKLVPVVDKNYKSINEVSGDNIKLIDFSNNQFELVYVENEIKKIVANPENKYSDIAIIYRGHRDVIDFVRLFDRKNIPYKLNSNEDLLTSFIVNKFLNILRVIFDPYDHESFFDVLTFPFLNINLVSVYKLNHQLSRINSDGSRNLLEFCIEKSSLEQMGLFESDTDKISKIANILMELKSISMDHELDDFLIRVANETGFMSGILEQKVGAEELLYLNINKLNSFFQFVKSLCEKNENYSFKNLLEDIQVMKNAGFQIKEEKLELNTNGINLLTAHGSKGSEFDNVFIVKAQQKSWEGRDTKFIRYFDEINEKSDETLLLEEERRLFYVAMTRAKKNLTITSSKLNVSNGNDRDQKYIEFLDELTPENITKLDSSEIESKLGEDVLKLNFKEEKKLANTNEETEYFSDLLKNFKLSASSMTEYLSCAYRFKLDRLVKIPRNPQFIFGSVIHSAFEEYFLLFKNSGVKPTQEKMKLIFLEKLKSHNLPKEKYEKEESKGLELIDIYFDSFGELIKIPFSVEGNFHAELDDFGLNGKIDKIEQVSENEFLIVDYKSGKSYDIEKQDPKTKLDHKYLMQLKFYKLLLLSDNRFKDKTLKFCIDFISPDREKVTAGRTRNFDFTIEEIEDLRKLIRQCMSDIHSQKFERTKDHMQCKHCRHKNHCWPLGVPNY